MQVFDRTSTGVELTDAGRLLLEQASKLLEQADELARKTGGLRESGNTLLKTLVAGSNVVAPFPLALVTREIEAGVLAALSPPPDWLHLAYGIIQLARGKPSALAQSLIRHLQVEDQQIAELESRVQP